MFSRSRIALCENSLQVLFVFPSEYCLHREAFEFTIFSSERISFPYTINLDMGYTIVFVQIRADTQIRISYSFQPPPCFWSARRAIQAAHLDHKSKSWVVWIYAAIRLVIGFSSIVVLLYGGPLHFTLRLAGQKWTYISSSLWDWTYCLLDSTKSIRVRIKTLKTNSSRFRRNIRKVTRESEFCRWKEWL